MQKEKFESDRYKKERLIGFLFGLAAGAIGAWVAAGVYSSAGIFKNTKWWEALSSLATAAAVIVALWVGVRDSRWRQEQEKTSYENAKLYVLSVERLMLHIAFSIEDIPDPTKNNNKYDTKAAEELSVKLLDMLKGFDLPSIRKVDEKAANTLIQALGAFYLFVTFLDIGTDQSIEAFKHDRKYVSDTIKEARKYLSKVLKFQE